MNHPASVSRSIIRVPLSRNKMRRKDKNKLSTNRTKGICGAQKDSIDMSHEINNLGHTKHNVARK
jgi:hypothetical protein